MDDGERLAALEEEMAILRGEIKSILQEVRVALLSRDNPFAMGFPENTLNAPSSVHPGAIVHAPVPAGEERPVRTMLAQTATPPPEAVSPAPPAETSGPGTAPGGIAPAVEAVSARVRQLATGSLPEEGSTEPAALRRWSRRQMATLMSWTQEIAGRFTRRDFILLLTIARHGGLVDRQLQETLTELAESLSSQEGAPATINDFMLALHQLEAVVAPGDAPADATRAA